MPATAGGKALAVDPQSAPTQPLPSSVPRDGEPSVHGPLRHAQGLGHFAATPTLILQVQGLEATPLAKVAILGGHFVLYRSN